MFRRCDSLAKPLFFFPAGRTPIYLLCQPEKKTSNETIPSSERRAAAEVTDPFFSPPPLRWDRCCCLIDIPSVQFGICLVKARKVRSPPAQPISTRKLTPPPGKFSPCMNECMNGGAFCRNYRFQHSVSSHTLSVVMSQAQCGVCAPIVSALPPRAKHDASHHSLSPFPFPPPLEVIQKKKKRWTLSQLSVSFTSPKATKKEKKGNQRGRLPCPTPLAPPTAPQHQDGSPTPTPAAPGPSWCHARSRSRSPRGRRCI